MTKPNAQYRCYKCGGMSDVDADCTSKLTEAEPSCTFVLNCTLCGTTNSVTLFYDEVMSTSTADLGYVYAPNEPKKKESKMWNDDTLAAFCESISDLPIEHRTRVYVEVAGLLGIKPELTQGREVYTAPVELLTADELRETIAEKKQEIVDRPSWWDNQYVDDMQATVVHLENRLATVLARFSINHSKHSNAILGVWTGASSWRDYVDSKSKAREKGGI